MTTLRAEWHTAHYILRRVATHYRHTVSELLADGPGMPIVEYRQIAMYMCREHTALSYPDLGRLFRRDHATVMHGVQMIGSTRSKRVKTAVQEVDDMITAALSAARGSVPA